MAASAGDDSGNSRSQKLALATDSAGQGRQPDAVGEAEECLGSAEPDSGPVQSDAHAQTRSGPDASESRSGTRPRPSR